MDSNRKIFAIIFVAILLVDGMQAEDKCECTTAYTTAATTGIGLLIAAPYVIGALGFGPIGIAAGSVASKMMSTAAITGYGGGLVGSLQAAGAAGLGIGAKTGIVAVGTAAGYKASGGCDCPCP